MKMIIGYLFGLLIAGISTQADIIPSITETSSGLASNFGASISGSQDDWTVTAPGGSFFLFFPPSLSSVYYVPESDNPGAFNILTPGGVGLVSSFTWRSDVTLLPLGTPSASLFLAPPITAEQIPILVSLSDTGDPSGSVGVPDTGSTLLLLGLGLLGLWFTARAGTGAESGLRV